MHYNSKEQSKSNTKNSSDSFNVHGVKEVPIDNSNNLSKDGADKINMNNPTMKSEKSYRTKSSSSKSHTSSKSHNSDVNFSPSGYSDSGGSRKNNSVIIDLKPGSYKLNLNIVNTENKGKSQTVNITIPQKENVRPTVSVASTAAEPLYYDNNRPSLPRRLMKFSRSKIGTTNKVASNEGGKFRLSSNGQTITILPVSDDTNGKSKSKWSFTGDCPKIHKENFRWVPLACLENNKKGREESFSEASGSESWQGYGGVEHLKRQNKSVKCSECACNNISGEADADCNVKLLQSGERWPAPCETSIGVSTDLKVTVDNNKSAVNNIDSDTEWFDKYKKKWTHDETFLKRVIDEYFEGTTSEENLTNTNNTISFEKTAIYNCKLDNILGSIENCAVSDAGPFNFHERIACNNSGVDKYAPSPGYDGDIEDNLDGEEECDLYLHNDVDAHESSSFEVSSFGTELVSKNFGNELKGSDTEQNSRPHSVCVGALDSGNTQCCQVEQVTVSLSNSLSSDVSDNISLKASCNNYHQFVVSGAGEEEGGLPLGETSDFGVRRRGYMISKPIELECFNNIYTSSFDIISDEDDSLCEEFENKLTALTYTDSEESESEFIDYINLGTTVIFERSENTVPKCELREEFDVLQMYKQSDREPSLRNATKTTQEWTFGLDVDNGYENIEFPTNFDNDTQKTQQPGVVFLSDSNSADCFNSEQIKFPAKPGKKRFAKAFQQPFDNNEQIPRPCSFDDSFSYFNRERSKRHLPEKRYSQSSSSCTENSRTVDINWNDKKGKKRKSRKYLSGLLGAIGNVPLFKNSSSSSTLSDEAGETPSNDTMPEKSVALPVSTDPYTHQTECTLEINTNGNDYWRNVYLDHVGCDSSDYNEMSTGYMSDKTKLSRGVTGFIYPNEDYVRTSPTKKSPHVNYNPYENVNYYDDNDRNDFSAKSIEKEFQDEKLENMSLDNSNVNFSDEPMSPTQETSSNQQFNLSYMREDEDVSTEPIYEDWVSCIGESQNSITENRYKEYIPKTTRSETPESVHSENTYYYSAGANTIYEAVSQVRKTYADESDLSDDNRTTLDVDSEVGSDKLTKDLPYTDQIKEKDTASSRDSCGSDLIEQFNELQKKYFGVNTSQQSLPVEKDCSSSREESEIGDVYCAVPCVVLNNADENIDESEVKLNKNTNQRTTSFRQPFNLNKSASDSKCTNHASIYDDESNISEFNKRNSSIWTGIEADEESCGESSNTSESKTYDCVASEAAHSRLGHVSSCEDISCTEQCRFYLEKNRGFYSHAKNEEDTVSGFESEDIIDEIAVTDKCDKFEDLILPPEKEDIYNQKDSCKSLNTSEISLDQQSCSTASENEITTSSGNDSNLLSTGLVVRRKVSGSGKPPVSPGSRSKEFQSAVLNRSGSFRKRSRSASSIAKMKSSATANPENRPSSLVGLPRPSSYGDMNTKSCNSSQESLHSTYLMPFDDLAPHPQW